MASWWHSCVLIAMETPFMQVSQLANYLKSIGVGRGSDVTIYMPMIPELPAAMVPPLTPSSSLDAHCGSTLASGHLRCGTQKMVYRTVHSVVGSYRGVGDGCQAWTAAWNG